MQLTCLVGAGRSSGFGWKRTSGSGRASTHGFYLRKLSRTHDTTGFPIVLRHISTRLVGDSTTTENQHQGFSRGWGSVPLHQGQSVRDLSVKDLENSGSHEGLFGD